MLVSRGYRRHMHTPMHVLHPTLGGLGEYPTLGGLGEHLVGWHFEGLKGSPL